MGYFLVLQVAEGNIVFVRTVFTSGMPRGSETRGYPGMEYTFRSVLRMVTHYDVANPLSPVNLTFPVLSALSRYPSKEKRSLLYVPGLSFLEVEIPVELPEISATRVLSGPRVLIYHTHTSEMYLGPERAETSLRDSHYVFRSAKDDKQTGVMEVGQYMAERLSALGIPVLHEKKIHDFPSIAYSYLNSETTLRELLEKYPTIEVVLDIHRDAMIPEPVVVLEGKRVARILLLLGSAEDIPRPHPYHEENLRFAQRLYAVGAAEFPGLIRPLQVRSDARFNQHLHPQSLLIEVGTVQNTLEEALRAAEYLSLLLAKLLLGG